MCYSCNKSDNEEIPPKPEGSENLGSGYDVFDNYAETYKVKATILDVDKLNSAGLIESKTIEHSTFSTSSGKTIEEYRSSLNVNVSLEGQYKFFSGAIKTNFDEDRYNYQEFAYATVKNFYQKKQLRLPPDKTVQDLKRYLTSTAKKNLNDPAITPEYIFTTYGTHCLTGVILGGRIDYNVSAKKSDLMNGKSISVYAEASFSKGGVSVKGSTGVVTNSEYMQFTQSVKKRLLVYGGQSEFGQDIIDSSKYKTWINSIENHSVFCNFTEQGLKPVWEFCDEQNRKNELSEYFKTWASAHEVKTKNIPRSCILDIKVYFGQNIADPLNINGRIYRRLNYDLNTGAGGSYIYLYYLEGYENDPEFSPLAEIHILNTTRGETLSSLPGAGWIQLPENLNKGAGGDNMFIVFRRIIDPNDRLITGLRIQYWNHPKTSQNNVYSTNATVNNWFACTQGYGGTNMADLNAGCGGDSYWIYLYYTGERLNWQ